MLNRTLTATARDHTTQTGGLHEKFMCALPLKHVCNICQETAERREISLVASNLD